MNGAWVGVVGTAIGVVAGGATAALADWQKWRRDGRARWYGERRQLYAKVIGAATAAKEAGDTFAILYGASLNEPGREYEVSEAAGVFQTRLRELGALTWEVALIGTADTRIAAETLGGAATRLTSAQAALYGQFGGDDRIEQIDTASRAFQAATVAFVNAARSEIGLPDAAV